jgi:ADP-ribose pyrophosphatase
MKNNKSQSVDLWKKLKRRTVLSTPFIDVWEDTVQLPNGHIIEDYSLVNLGDGVLVVATDEEDNLITFREYKYAANEILLGFPGGGVNENETPAQAAARELLEETGYKSTELEYIAPLNVYPSKIVHINHVVRAKNARRIAKPEHEVTESIGEIDLIPLTDIARLQKEGVLNATYLLAALALTMPEYLSRPNN